MFESTMYELEISKTNKRQTKYLGGIKKTLQVYDRNVTTEKIISK